MRCLLLEAWLSLADPKSENSHNSYRARFGENSNVDVDNDDDDYYDYDDDDDDDSDNDNKSWVTTNTFIQTDEGLAKPEVRAETSTNLSKQTTITISCSVIINN